ncbi:putative sh3 domain protein [Lipomyces arxii]|uniref:putative sh3 domain protein n=1 Tax=Lipomyces arxii TaxID=56418 RepID=UPI0034CFB968
MEWSSRPSIDSYSISDLDLSETTGWWTQPEAVPPTLLNKSQELTWEVDETMHTRRGKRIIERKVYVLYPDYSQTIVTVKYEAENAGRVKFEQHHKPSPPPLRRDQLEDAYMRFGAEMKKFASESAGQSIGDGSPFAYVQSVIARFPDALPPVGRRAYGAVVYSNFGNASVTQTDEIKPGDIITFKNSKFQGHKGSLHTKYSVEAGKPLHCAVVTEWDGTKKKIKVLEQPKDKGRVRMESYRLSDLRSGEVVVYRVVGREYVGWEGDM